MIRGIYPKNLGNIAILFGYNRLVWFFVYVGIYAVLHHYKKAKKVTRWAPFSSQTGFLLIEIK
jgi:hypothetical protein